MTEGRVQKMHHASLLVGDTQRALTFYKDLLGLRPEERPELGFPGAWLCLGNGQTLHLLELPDPSADAPRPEHGGRDRHLALQVDVLAPFIARLEDLGIPYTASRSGRAAIFCRDPDGNAIELVEQPG
ncbi:MAG: VOC family protein [Halothiobacillaceae bacterium]